MVGWVGRTAMVAAVPFMIAYEDGIGSVAEESGRVHGAGVRVALSISSAVGGESMVSVLR